METSVSRRNILGLAAAGLVGTTVVKPGFGKSFGSAAHDFGAVLPGSAPGIAVVAPQEKIRVALIGCGGQGKANLRVFMQQPDTLVTVVCDPDANRMREAADMAEDRYDVRPAEVKDYRNVVTRKDVDVVIVGTPDHWHALPMIAACMNGKDVFCEKPISHNIMEGRQMVDFATHYKRIVQVGTWQRSQQQFLDAVTYVRSGKLGKINVCRAWKIQAPKAAVLGKVAPSEPPKDVDYDLWVGPAAMVPYQSNRLHYNHRWYYNFAGGMVGDWGVHMMDIVLLGMSKSDNLVQPSKVTSLGGKFYVGPEDDRTTPDTLMTLYNFDNWIMDWEVHVGDQAVGVDGGRDHGALFIGSEGRLLVDRAGWSIFDAQGKPVEKPAPKDWGGTMNGLGTHVREFLNSVKTRGTTRSNVASMHQTTTACHLANLAYLSGETLHWDTTSEKVTNVRKAMDELPYKRKNRKGFELPKLG